MNTLNPPPVMPGPSLDFASVNAVALRHLLCLLKRWLPDGKIMGREYIARNPRRGDRNPGSFKVNVYNGKWSDFATDDKGGDVISFAAYLFDLSQAEAARKLAIVLGLTAPEDAT